MVQPHREVAVSSFRVKSSLVQETYATFLGWDFALSRGENLQRMKEGNTIGASSANWLRDVAKILNRRYQPNGRDRALVELAQAGCSQELWKPILLWHLTRDEFLVWDFLVNWLYPQYEAGAFRIRAEDVHPYLQDLNRRKLVAKPWGDNTLKRVASGLLRMAVDFDMMRGTLAREFASYHLPDEAMLYLLHAISEQESNPRAVVESVDWRMYLMDPDDVERELFRLHQYRKLRYEVAGSLAQLDLPCDTALQYAREYLV